MINYVQHTPAGQHKRWYQRDS